MADIRRYTVRQVEAFMGAIERRERDRNLSEAIALRMAQADGKDWRRYINSLRGAPP